jgi:hypothetical protein
MTRVNMFVNKKDPFRGVFSYRALLAALFASISCLIASLFAVFLDFDFFFLPIPVCLFAMIVTIQIFLQNKRFIIDKLRF